ncbi:hypothetical protein TWF506_008860 [Arthrobotrys conoides]|uniref:Reticulon-like protein n=1 Tax=Arthrobotrys conoides TaxID=74498 RepID=A0AAN8RWP0_9PEZI
MSDESINPYPVADPIVADVSPNQSNEINPFTPSKDPAPKDPTVTHFHSFFYDTFTWKYPRTTGLLFASSLAFFLLGHYVNILRYAFKAAYITFAATAAIEYLGRPTTGTGFMTQVRPAKYYTIPRENLEMVFAEIHEFLNFIVLEFQRVIFVENLTVTIASFVFSLIGYFLVKFMPIWSLLILADVLLFTAPLLYLQNQELIDSHIRQASAAANDQLQNARGLAEKHTADYSAKAKAYANDITGKLVSVYQDRQKITKSDTTKTE